MNIYLQRCDIFQYSVMLCYDMLKLLLALDESYKVTSFKDVEKVYCMILKIILNH